eukprot:31555-Pelagococcus_subviridis.AAC.11
MLVASLAERGERLLLARARHRDRLARVEERLARVRDDRVELLRGRREDVPGRDAARDVAGRADDADDGAAVLLNSRRRSVRARRGARARPSRRRARAIARRERVRDDRRCRVSRHDVRRGGARVAMPKRRRVRRVIILPFFRGHVSASIHSRSRAGRGNARGVPRLRIDEN